MLENQFENLILNNDVIGESFTVIDSKGIEHEYKIVANSFEYSFSPSKKRCYVSSFIAVDIKDTKLHAEGRRALFDYLQATKHHKSFLNPLIIYEIPSFCCNFYHDSFLDFYFDNGKNPYYLNQTITDANWNQIKEKLSYQIEFLKILVRHIGPSLFKELQNYFFVQAKMNRHLSQTFDEKEFKQNFFNTFKSSLREYQKSHDYSKIDDDQDYK